MAKVQKEIPLEKLLKDYPKISSTSKLGDIPTINMPKGITCRKNAPCAKCCYVNHSKMNYSTAQICYKRNLEVFKNNPELFFKKIDIFLDCMIGNYFRWHACGDIPDEEYLAGMAEIAKKHKEINFLCFTKKYELCNEYFTTHEIPENLNIVFSCWYDFIPENPHNFPMVFVKDKCQELEAIKGFLEFNPCCVHECKYNQGNGGCPCCIKHEPTNCWIQKEGAIIMERH